MTSNQNKSPRAGNQGGTHEQHVQAGRQSHKNDASHQSDSLSNQQSGKQSIGSQQSGRQSNQSQQSGSRSDSQQSDRPSNQSQQSGSRSGAGVQGGTPEQHAAAGRQSHKNDKNR